MAYSANLYEIKSGDNLWNICKRELGLTTNKDIAEKVEEISRKNNISANSIWVGQKIDLCTENVPSARGKDATLAEVISTSAKTENDTVDNNSVAQYLDRSYHYDEEFDDAINPYRFVLKSVANKNSDAGKDVEIAPNGQVTKVYSKEEIDKIIEREALACNVDSTLVRAIIATESSNGQFEKNKRSGAAGLMQLMPRTAESLGCENPYDATENIRAGVKHFARLLKLYDGNVEHAIRAYNVGEGNFNKYLRGEKDLPRETIAYLPKVMYNYKKISAQELS